MHPDASAFLRAMLDAPRDDAPAGAFADWLQEHPDQIAAVLAFFVDTMHFNGYRLRYNWPAATRKLPAPLPGERTREAAVRGTV